MKKRTYAWEELKNREDLKGCVVEVFTDFNPDPHPRHCAFIRGILTGIEWKDGRPAKVRFTDALRYVIRGRHRIWEKYSGRTFICNIRRRFSMRIADQDSPLRKCAYIDGGIITFSSLRFDHIALFPGRKDKVMQRPYFYRTARQAEDGWRSLLKRVR